MVDYFNIWLCKRLHKDSWKIIISKFFSFFDEFNSSCPDIFSIILSFDQGCFD